MTTVKAGAPSAVAKRKPLWAERVDSILKVKERSRSWLARRIGIDPGRLIHIMGGDPRYILHPFMRRRICEALEVPESLIFEEESDGRAAIHAGEVEAPEAVVERA